jgi:Mor family transcriptional regulator
MTQDAPDFLQDVIDRLTLAISSTREKTPERLAAITQVETDLRHHYGNDRVSIRVGTSARNAAIVRDYLAGEHYPLLERRYGLTKRHLIRIIKGQSGE